VEAGVPQAGNDLPTAPPGCPEGLSPHTHVAGGISWAVTIWFKEAKPRLEQKLTRPSYVYSCSFTVDGVFSYIQKKQLPEHYFPSCHLGERCIKNIQSRYNFHNCNVLHQDNMSTLLAPAFENRRPKKIATVCSL